VPCPASPFSLNGWRKVVMKSQQCSCCFHWDLACRNRRRHMRKRRTSREVQLSKRKGSSEGSRVAGQSAALRLVPPPIWPQGSTWDQACEWWATVRRDAKQAALDRRAAAISRSSSAVIGGERTRFIVVRHPAKDGKNLEVGTSGPSPVKAPSRHGGPSSGAVASNFRTGNEYGGFVPLTGSHIKGTFLNQP